jgi:hypothetical protein
MTGPPLGGGSRGATQARTDRQLPVLGLSPAHSTPAPATNLTPAAHTNLTLLEA